MASKRRIRRKQCGDKQRHKSEAEATAHAVSYLHKFGKYKRAYRCSWCHYWHVGAPSKVDAKQRGYRV